MQISPIRNRYTNNNNFQLNRKKIKTSQILFTGNDTVERKRFGKDIFVHQTALFREPITDRFVQNYVMDNFCDKHEINIVSGACSSGEEVYSYACMLNDSGKKINIIGFDISKKIIKIAKKGIIKVKNYRQNYGRKVLTSEDFLLDDSILASYKKKCKNNFFKYFKPQSEKETLQLPSYLYKMQKQRCENIEQLIEIFGKYDFSKIEEKIKSMYNDLILNNTYEMQTFKFDFAKASNCNIYFKHGDVLKLDKLFKKKNSVDVLLYRNALYHNLCTTPKNHRTMRSNSCEIMNSIAKGMNAILSKDGLVVFGENEDRQGIDKNLIFDIMTKNGFEPIYLHDDKGKNNVNVWRKISENVINQSS